MKIGPDKVCTDLKFCCFSLLQVFETFHLTEWDLVNLKMVLAHNIYKGSPQDAD